MHLSFSEAKLEQAIIELLQDQGYQHLIGDNVPRSSLDQVIIEDDLRHYLAARYQADGITEEEIQRLIKQFTTLPASDLYESNKTFCAWLANGFLFKRDDRQQKDLYIELLDTRHLPAALRELFDTEDVPLQQAAETPASYHLIQPLNRVKIVNQLTITGKENQPRIPDAILYINGLPLVVFEFKSAVREQEANIGDAWKQLCTRYRRDIPQLFVYNALCIISDGVNNRMGNLFAPYEYFYSWRKVTGNENREQNGIPSLHSMIQGLFHPVRLLDVIKNFICFPDKAKHEVKICCRYPQYYAARKLYYSIERARKPFGDGKGGTYFGATGCGKSYTMQFLTRLLMKSVEFASPTIVLITDRTDLDDQLSAQMCNAKNYIGDDTVVPVTSRDDLREKLAGRNSGGVFLTTIHKFTEDTELLSERSNIICISDEAHRSQVNLDQKVIVDKESGRVRKTYGFAKYLHDSLPRATYVGFTGTPIDATMDVFGVIVDSYTMTESVQDEITVRIVYEGRAAKVILDAGKLEEVEKYYEECANAGTNEWQIDESKKASATMNAILGDEDRLKALAEDFAKHYEKRVAEGSTVKGDAPDLTQMNARVREMIAEALKADGVEELFFLGDKKAESIDIFDDDYLARINKIKLPATKIQLLQKLLEKAISDFKQINQLQGINFTRRFQSIMDKYNERREDDVLNGEEFDNFSQEMTDIIYDIKTEMGTYAEMGIDIEEKAFYDILAHMRDKYQFTYEDDKMLALAKEMKAVVDNTSKYPDWSKRDDIKAKLKVELILLLHKHKFPPVANDDVYMGVLSQAENFKQHHSHTLH
ncbi:HsdR family type I site-specific deoxyribonuclease [Salmonella enterica]|nr:HsdR family type I site-specific deoxyribonuclease [Salmonella enterica]